MKRNLFILLLPVLWIITGSFRGNFSETASIAVNITKCKNDKGVLRVAVYRGENGFPSDVSKAVQVKVSAIRSGTSTLTFTGLEAGKDYAVAVYHDENNNNKMDTNFMGIPSEGYAASRDAKGRFGPPKYEDAKVILKEGTQMLTLKMTY